MKGITVLLLALSCCLSEPVSQNKKPYCCPPDPCTLANELAAMKEKLATTEDKLATTEDKLGLMETRLQTSENEMEDLRGLIEDRPQVAFSATLREPGATGNTGPFPTDTPLEYKNVFSNTGNSYDSSTGIFTAKVKGMYYFRFSMMNNVNAPPNSVVELMKNDKRLVSVWDTVGEDAHDMGSNAVVIPLEVGDNVYVQLQANRLVFDDEMNYNTFSGFLLFPM